MNMNRWKDILILALVAAFGIACATGQLAHKKDATVISELHGELTRQETLNRDHAAHNSDAVAKIKAAMDSLESCDSYK